MKKFVCCSLLVCLCALLGHCNSIVDSKENDSQGNEPRVERVNDGGQDTLPTPDTLPAPDTLPTPDSPAPVDCQLATPASPPTTAWLAVPLPHQSDRNVGRAITRDAQGNVYMAGTFTRSMKVGQTVLQAAREGVYLAKIDAQGSFVWLKDPKALGLAAASGDSMVLQVDASGHVYWLYGGAQVAKIAPQGSSVWQVNLAPQGLREGRGLAIAADGKIFVTGQNILAIQLSPQGQVLWAHKSSVAKISFYGGRAIAANAKGESYVAGSNGVALLKLDPKGAILWQEHQGKDSFVNGIALDPTGNVYIAGAVRDSLTFGQVKLAGYWNCFVLKWTPDGKAVWGAQSKGGLCSANGLSVGPSGNSFITGGLQNEVNFGKTDVKCLGEDDSFVAQLNSQGIFVWAKRAGSSYVGMESERGQKLLLDGLGGLYVVGWSLGDADFWGTPVKSSQQNSYAWKITLPKTACQP